MTVYGDMMKYMINRLLLNVAGIIDQTRYNTLLNQVMHSSDIPMKSTSVSSLNSMTSQKTHRSFTQSGDSTRPSRWKRRSRDGGGAGGGLTNRVTRSMSATSLLSADSKASDDSQGKMFIRNPKSNALVDLKTAYSQVCDFRVCFNIPF